MFGRRPGWKETKHQRGQTRRTVRLEVWQLEDRITPSWWGIPPGTIALPSDAVTVNLNSQGDAQGNAAITSDEVDYYTLVAPVSGQYRVEALTPLTSLLDPVLGIFNAAGTRIAYNDDQSSYNTDSSLTVALNAGERYYFGITNFTGSAGGDYTWSLNGPAPTATDDGYEDNDTLAAARDLGAVTSRRQINNLVMADGHDWYRFTLGSTGSSAHYVAIAFQHALGDIDMELFNSSGTRLGLSEGVIDSERLSLNGLGAGVYYVHVYGYLGATNPSYNLDINPPGGTTILRPDLSGALLNATNSAQWGQTIAVTARMRNSGNASAGAFRLQWYLSRDAIGSSDDLLLVGSNGVATFGHAGIAAHSYGPTFTMSMRLPSALPSGWSGSTFYVVTRIDVANQVVESNEANNFGQLGNGLDRDPITIAAAPPPTDGAFRIQLVISGMTANQQNIFRQAVARWERVIVGDLPDAVYNGQTVDDVMIGASGVTIDGPGNILGQAGPDRFRSGSYLPYHGIMEFDTADLASMESNGTLYAVILHEMGHVLGIGTIWESKGLLSGAGGSDPRFTGAQARAAYNQLFGRNETGVPVENTGGPGTRDGHWREAVFSTELMTGWIGPGTTMPLSRVTVASLADLGYQVNMNAADAFTPSSTSSLRLFLASSDGGSYKLNRASRLGEPINEASRDAVFVILGQSSEEGTTNSHRAKTDDPPSRRETGTTARSATPRRKEADEMLAFRPPSILSGLEGDLEGEEEQRDDFGSWFGF